MAVSMPSVVSVRTIRTAASSIQGGVTTYDNGNSHKNGPKTVTHPGDPTAGECPGCIYGEEGTCIICGHDPVLDPLEGGYCECEECENEEDGHCHCTPLSDGWQVWLMMALLAGAYALHKKRTPTEK